jgi:hypothetical protein
LKSWSKGITLFSKDIGRNAFFALQQIKPFILKTSIYAAAASMNWMGFVKKKYRPHGLLARTRKDRTPLGQDGLRNAIF